MIENWSLRSHGVLNRVAKLNKQAIATLSKHLKSGGGWRAELLGLTTCKRDDVPQGEAVSR